MAELLDFEGAWDADLVFEMSPVAEDRLAGRVEIEFHTLRAAVGSLFDKRAGDAFLGALKSKRGPRVGDGAPRDSSGPPGASPGRSRAFLDDLRKLGFRMPAELGGERPPAPRRRPKR